MPKLLVVDDNAINLTLFRHLLQKLEGAEVECIDDPKAALDWCAANDPDLILLDYMMPEVNGLEFIERLRLIPGRADVPVVMVTADTESDVRHRALQLGAPGLSDQAGGQGRTHGPGQESAGLAQEPAATGEPRRLAGRGGGQGHGRDRRPREGGHPAPVPRGGIPRPGNRQPPVAHVQLHTPDRHPTRASGGRAATAAGSIADARHRQGGYPGPDPAQARPADSGRVRGHEAARHDRLRNPARLGVSAATMRGQAGAGASREIRRQRLSAGAGRRGYPPCTGASLRSPTCSMP
jgi:CheY-like chemotaxis protein